MDSPVPILEETVIHGALFLDELDEDWFKKIDISELQMASAYRCICGQLFLEKVRESCGEYESGYDWALDNLGLGDYGRPWGFAPVEDVYDEKYREFWNVSPQFEFTKINSKAYDILAEMWLSQIEKRKAEAGLMLEGK